MDAQGKHFVRLDPGRTWDALNALPLLRDCLPGCQSLTREDDGTITLVQQLRVAEHSARFRVALRVEDADRPHSYVLSFEGSAGDAGFGAGHALVALQPEDNGTWVQYQLMFESGGTLSHFGQEALQHAVHALIEAFFKRFDARVAGRPLPSGGPLRRWLRRLRPAAVALLAVAVVLATYLRLHGFW